MRVVFLETSRSATAGFPFEAGQIVTIETLTPEIRDALASHRAEVMREEPQIETAMITTQQRRRQVRRRAVQR